jgi:hypothetical protein
MAKQLRRRLGSRRGNAFVEFSLCFMLFLTMLVAMFEFSWLLFVKSTLHHGVREAVRAAITGKPGAGYESNHDGYVESILKANTFGILDDAAIEGHVKIEYFNLDGSPLANPAPGAIIQVSVQCYDIMPISSLIRPRDAGGNLQPITVSVYSSDRMEPFSEAPPPRGTAATAPACQGS